jgi:hypothetical protein
VRLPHPTAKFVSGCSFALLTLLCHANYTSTYDRVKGQTSLNEARRIANQDPMVGSDPAVAGATSIEQLKTVLELHSRLESGSSGKAADAITKIKSSPLYTDKTEKKGSNWLQKAAKNFMNLFKSPNKVDLPDMNLRKIQLPFLLPLTYGILAILLAVFIYYVAREFSIKRRLRRAAATVLEEDEPMRTLDEWLEQADQLEREGRYREAVRCLYLACLLKFDEADVARFIRTQTNWEHLARIKKSPTLPPDIQFEQPTRDFDHIWYGYRVKGASDVAQFRSVYTNLKFILEGRRA